MAVELRCSLSDIAERLDYGLQFGSATDPWENYRLPKSNGLVISMKAMYKRHWGDRKHTN